MGAPCDPSGEAERAALRREPLALARNTRIANHDRSAQTLLDVVEHYDATLSLDLSEAQKDDLIQFLKLL